jgi:hypothetical protein
MASAVYPKFKEALLQGGANTNLSSGTVKAVLVDTGTYTYSSAHEFFSSVSGIAQSSAANAEVTIDNKTFVNGVFNTSDDTDTFPALDATATDYEALVIYVDTGVAGTSRLVAYVDGFSAITPNGGTAVVDWDDGANGIFAL